MNMEMNFKYKQWRNCIKIKLCMQFDFKNSEGMSYALTPMLNFTNGINLTKSCPFTFTSHHKHKRAHFEYRSQWHSFGWLFFPSKETNFKLYIIIKQKKNLSSLSFSLQIFHRIMISFCWLVCLFELCK